MGSIFSRSSGDLALVADPARQNLNMGDAAALAAASRRPYHYSGLAEVLCLHILWLS
jgi:hypothetical protein